MFQYYLIHYFNFKNAGGFMLVSLLCLIAVLAIVILTAKLKKHYKLNTQDLTPKQIRKLNHIHKVKEISLIESFYEMVFSSTSVLLFLSLYYIIDERIPQAAFYWQKYQNIILLLFLVFSVFMTNWFDILFVPLTAIPTRQKASVRLISAFYIILILLYIKFIYHDSNYDSLIMYFITLAVGQVTPPYGLCLLIAGRISGMSVQKSFKAVIPYIMVSVVVVVLIAFLPDIAFALPKLIKPEWF